MHPEELAGNLQAGRQQLAEDLRAVVRDAEALLRIASRDAGEGYAEARARLELSLAAARVRLEAAERQLADRALEAGRSADRYVRDNPWGAVGIGAGLGLLAGVLLGRR